MVVKMADYMTTQWYATRGSFLYHDNSNPDPRTADLNMMIVPM